MTILNISFQAGEKLYSAKKLKGSIDTSNQSCNKAKHNEFRTDELNQYLNLPLPTRRSEHWKYNDMSFLSNTEYLFEPQVKPASAAEAGVENFVLDHAVLIKLVDGVLFSVDNTDPNVTVTTFCNTDQKQSELVLESLQLTKQKKNLLINLNAALAPDGLLVEISGGGNFNRPIHVIYESSQNNDFDLTANQVIIYCKKNSQVTIVEEFRAQENEPATKQPSLALQQTIIQLAQNSRCRHYRLNKGSSETRQVSRLVARLEKNSHYNGFYFSNGSLLSKTDVDILHQGEHSVSELNGIYLPSNSRCVDYHTNIEHQVANGNSAEVFRGIIADSAKATFSGKIHIFKGAQKINAQLNNKNLLLTNRAEINTKPELEIYADDVVCAHGATVAKIDEQAIYYLQARGINLSDAKRMLSHGFIIELLDKIGDPTIRGAMSRIVLNALSNNS